MPPYASNEVTLIKEKIKATEFFKSNTIPKLKDLKWFNIILLTIVHVGFAYGIFTFPWLSKKRLFLWQLILGSISGFGVTGGAHRLWCHRSYKAKLPLRIILMICYCMMGHNPLFNWVRDHRVHHKFTDTDADPHNSKRGFFFSHVGWLFMKKHPEVVKRGKEVDMSDLWEDPVIRFHQKYYIVLVILLGFVLPSIVPPLWWGEEWYWAIITTCIGRYCLQLNFTWLVNSAAHIYGTRPYDKNISPTENVSVAIVTLGEGWHNYHHIFPWDYKAAEFGRYRTNTTTFWIDLFAKIGWAYDLKQPSPELVKKTIQKFGDGTHPTWNEIPDPSEKQVKNE
ncbi:hypothetical protein RN001_006528 [Aquatica leii]|uniref:Fatty acid desaturase domain-containing protein n=1 Tax=Aquatica leii TaxID=1421715 RepID=A0AAN7PDS7_9COLE|nr:hypothetical protein RN001_006528 [Aquatica leii]